jgi:hypothetical protein
MTSDYSGRSLILVGTGGSLRLPHDIRVLGTQYEIHEFCLEIDKRTMCMASTSHVLAVVDVDFITKPSAIVDSG